MSILKTIFSMVLNNKFRNATTHKKRQLALKDNAQYTHRANVLRACQQRVGLYTKFRAGELKPRI